MSRTTKKQDNKPKFDTTPYQRPGLTESDILEIKEVFDMFDREHCGTINPKGILPIMLDIKSALSGLGPEARAEAIYQVAVDLCSEGHGNISFEEFIHLLTPKLLENDSRENIDKIFGLFDTDKTGYISVNDLRRIAKQMDFECSD